MNVEKKGVDIVHWVYIIATVIRTVTNLKISEQIFEKLLTSIS